MKKVTEEKIEEKVLDYVINFPHYGHWHGKKEFTIAIPRKIGEKTYDYKINLTLSGMITGCGAGQLYGFTSLPLDQSSLFKEFVKNELCKYAYDTGIGIIVCTLGQAYYGYENLLLEAGFEKTNEYHNWRHGSTYKQRMYALVVKKPPAKRKTTATKEIAAQ